MQLLYCNAMETAAAIVRMKSGSQPGTRMRRKQTMTRFALASSGSMQMAPIGMFHHKLTALVTSGEPKLLCVLHAAWDIFGLMKLL